MVDVQTDRMIRQTKRALTAQGLDGNLNLNLLENRMWYKPDGTAIGPFRLTDTTFQKYTERGWSLVPPSAPVPVELKGPSPIEREIIKAKAKQALDQDFISKVADDEPPLYLSGQDRAAMGLELDPDALDPTTGAKGAAAQALLDEGDEN